MWAAAGVQGYLPGGAELPAGQERSRGRGLPSGLNPGSAPLEEQNHCLREHRAFRK